MANSEQRTRGGTAGGTSAARASAGMYFSRTSDSASVNGCGDHIEPLLASSALDPRLRKTTPWPAGNASKSEASSRLPNPVWPTRMRQSSSNFGHALATSKHSSSAMHEGSDKVEMLWSAAAKTPTIAAETFPSAENHKCWRLQRSSKVASDPGLSKLTKPSAINVGGVAVVKESPAAARGWNAARRESSVGCSLKTGTIKS
mmetsp:Transcript_72700/g.201597  ORF Transcript_72700/g.201597 Transcript_72700/m.201597 type:complete len:202 (-) Transcript_72700:512-1117(-)